ncbi:uncharacterized protein LOC126836833 [Adelges cooleyi]|uniref:uncharacterized protein LOC126836833 n=1 Tax=Adelges cooleyi TaxID=133065 RepID=UPI00217FA3D9|nr:uncharacterized protein LOC126836833 [Adelges cooleyi]
MISKNIILFFCVVSFVQKCISDSKVEISTEDCISDSKEKIAIEDINEGQHEEVTDEWEKKFNKYDSNGDGLIFPNELQELLFHEFNGFITLNHASRCIALTNLNGSNQIGLDHFKHMKPIIAVLSRRDISEDSGKVNDEVVGEGTVLKEDLPKEISEDNGKVVCKESISEDRFVERIWNNFNNKVFDKSTEIDELFYLMGHNEDDPIESKKLKEIEEMLEASEKLNNMYKGFCMFDKDKNSKLTAEELVELIKYAPFQEATVENSQKSINNFDTNNDGVLDFSEFVFLMLNPDDGDTEFIKLFGKARITREQINDYLKLYGIQLTEEELEQMDPSNQNSISRRDVEKYVNSR